MKLTTAFFTISLALSTIATPLGDRAVFRRHTGVPANNVRRYILQSRMDAPPACVAKASSANSTNIPDLSNSTVTDPTVADAPTDTTLDGSVGGTDTTGNSTDTTNTDTANNSTDTTNTDSSSDAPADNSTATDASNSTDAGTRRRRRGVVTTSSAVELDFVDLAFEWQSLCLLSGGGIFLDNSPCLQLAGVHGFNALLADADPCAQQEFADSIITYAKSPGIVNSDALIAFALKYRRYPRSAVSILGVVPSTLYCVKAPVNPELAGIVNVQPDGVNPGLFGSPNDPMVPFGSDGTCPFGTTPDVSSCSCTPDLTNGTDASTLSDGSADNSTLSDPSVTASDNSTISDPSATASADDSTATDASTTTDDSTATDSAASDAPAPTDSAASDSGAASSTDAASATAADDSAPPAATDKASGPNFQPSDISGDVNDPNGRRK